MSKFTLKVLNYCDNGQRHRRYNNQLQILSLRAEKSIGRISFDQKSID